MCTSDLYLELRLLLPNREWPIQDLLVGAL